MKPMITTSKPQLPKEAAMNLDPRIGKLNSGKFYCFPNGYDRPEFVGSLEEVEAVLGIRAESLAPAKIASPTSESRLWSVKLKFQFPAWDEADGIEYRDIVASCKAEANAIARRRASNDGHLCGGKGRATFTATEQ
jgi:hypothetical protein